MGQSLKGVACDCKGLIAGAAREVGRPEARSFEALYVGYGRVPDSTKLLAGMERLFDRVTEMQRGDLLLINIGGEPKHMAIYSGDDLVPGEPRIIHAYFKGPRRVMESPLRDWDVHSVWRWRDGH